MTDSIESVWLVAGYTVRISCRLYCPKTGQCHLHCKDTIDIKLLDIRYSLDLPSFQLSNFLLPYMLVIFQRRRLERFLKICSIRKEKNYCNIVKSSWLLIDNVCQWNYENLLLIKVQKLIKIIIILITNIFQLNNICKTRVFIFHKRFDKYRKVLNFAIHDAAFKISAIHFITGIKRSQFNNRKNPKQNLLFWNKIGKILFRCQQSTTVA